MVNEVITGQINPDKLERLLVGRYKGIFVKNVMITDPWYLVWLVNNYADNKLSKEWVAKINEYSHGKNEPNYAGDYKRKRYSF